MGVESKDQIKGKILVEKSPLISSLVDQLAVGNEITLKDKTFRLHLDRPVPFLCVYRRPSGDKGHVGLNKFASCQTASLMAWGKTSETWSSLVEEIRVAMEARFGSFLVVELYELKAVGSTDEGGSVEPPAFEISVSSEQVPGLEALEKSLRKITIYGNATQSVIRKVSRNTDHNPFFAREVSECTDGRLGTCSHWIGLGVLPIYRSSKSGHLYPRVLAELELALRNSLLRTFHDFCRKETSLDCLHFHSLGRRHLADSVGDADRHLERVAESFSFLLMVTPTNSAEAWKAFKNSEYEEEPQFHYRPLDVDPEILKRTLYDVDIEKIEDPTLSRLFRQKQVELERQVSMISERETPNFVYGSLQVFGGVETSLLEAANEILAILKPLEKTGRPSRRVELDELRTLAQAEVDVYHELDHSFKVDLQVRSDIAAGMLVSRHKLLISERCRVPRNRVAALLHHEIGTHLLTYFNGAHQKLQLMHSGLAGYEGFQEGIAVLAEYLSGGLTRSRLRLLAARVIACGKMLRGMTFVETFRLLVDSYQFRPRKAFGIVTRIYRGGGLTKDAIYLRGFKEVCDHLSGDGDLEILFLGKMARHHLPDLRELLHRGVLGAPSLLPNYLKLPAAKERLQGIRDGLTLKELCQSFS